MQHYTLTEYADASSETRAVFDDFMRTTGATAVPVWLKSLGHSAPLTRAYWERAKGTLFAGNLPLPLKEMIVFVVSARNGARYCSACHAQNVLSLDKTLPSMTSGISSAPTRASSCRLITARWWISPARSPPTPTASKTPISRP